MSGFRAGESVHYGPDDENFALNLVYPWAPLCSDDLHGDGPYFLSQNPYTGQNRMASQSAAIPTNVNYGAAQVVVDVRAGVGAAPSPVSGLGPVVAIAAAIPAPIVQTQRLPAGMVLAPSLAGRVISADTIAVWGYDTGRYAAAMRAMPVLRELEMRPGHYWSNPVTSTQRSHRLATLAYLVGEERGDLIEETGNSCQKCKGGTGSMAKCVVFPGTMQNACTNCQYQNKPAECTFHRNG